MPFSLDLPDHLRAQGWKIKIRDVERNEPPHVTILRRTFSWRYGLREFGFLDLVPDPDDVPRVVVEEILRHAELLRREWDRMYPENPIDSETHR